MPLDPQKLASLIDGHAAALELWVRRRCASPEDVVQEAFCRLAAQEPCPDNPVAWLYRVCRNLAERQRLSDVRRRQREKSRARREAAGDSTVDALVAAETVLAVEDLEDDLREVLVARIWGQLPFEEIGKLCGISTATAFRRYEAALKVLRGKLKSKSEHRP